MEYFVLYLLGNTAGIKAFFIFAGVIVSVLSLVIAAMVSDAEGEPYKVPKKILVACTASIVLAVLIPSERSIQYIAAYYVGKEVVQTETVKKLTELVNVKLDEEIKDALKGNSK